MDKVVVVGVLVVVVGAPFATGGQSVGSSWWGLCFGHGGASRRRAGVMVMGDGDDRGDRSWLAILLRVLLLGLLFGVFQREPEAGEPRKETVLSFLGRWRILMGRGSG